MLHRLALGLGRTVAELELGMSGREFDDWQEFYAVEPFGSMRDNLHAGQIAAMIYNVNRGKRAPPIQASDFLLIERTASDEASEDARKNEQSRAAFHALAKPKGAK